MKKSVFFLIIVLLCSVNLMSGQLINFEQGEIEVTIRANAAGASGGFKDITNDKNAALDFKNIDEPVVSVIFQN